MKAELLDEHGVLEALGIKFDKMKYPRRLVLKLRRTGKIRGERIGSKIMFTAASVEDYKRSLFKSGRVTK